MEFNKRKKLILFPLPLQGCINPMIQLAKTLYSHNFSITIIHTDFNSPNPANHPDFTFLPIPDGVPDSEANTRDVVRLLHLVNAGCQAAFRDCLAELLSKERFACLIDDCGWTFTGAVAESFGLNRIVLQSYIGSWFVGHFAIPLLREKPYLPVLDSDAESPVPELPPLKMKDLPPILAEDPKLLDPYLKTLEESIKASSGVISNSCIELEQDVVSPGGDEFGVPIFPIGPFHGRFPASSSSLLAQDESCMEWLDKQDANSVIYVGLGSVATIEKRAFLEMAWGLRNSNRPFLWAVRPGSIHGSEWIESLPPGFVENLNGRGKITKWAPQQSVLGHKATGVFWTHCGWNSTLEGICEGVPMICQPCHWDQFMNARFICGVWKVGLHLENRIHRNEIEEAIDEMTAGKEGREIRERMDRMKEKIEKSLKTGGSSDRLLENLIDFISSF